MLLCVCNQFVIQLVLRLFLTGRISVGHLFHIVIVKLTWRQMFLRKHKFRLKIGIFPCCEKMFIYEENDFKL